MSASRYKAEDFIKVIPGSGAIKSVIAREVGCTRDTAHKWIKENAEVALAYENERQAVLDLAESAIQGGIHAGIKSGNTQDAKWYLTKKGKDRGYGDHKDINVTGQQLINIVFDEWDDDNERDEDKSTTEKDTTSDTVEGISEP